MNEFSRSLRSLESDDPRRVWVTLGLVAVFLGAWAAWFFFARVTLYEVTDTARLEVDQAVHPVEAVVEGRVVATRLAMGREVEEGEVLVELDAQAERLKLEEERARLTALRPQLETLAKEIAGRERSLGEAGHVTRAALEEARQDQREAESLADLAEAEAKRAEQLFQRDVLSEAELNRAKSEATRRRAAAQSRAMEVNRLELDERVRATDRRADQERLLRERDLMRGEVQSAEAMIQRLSYEIDRRSIRAPVAGRLGEVASLRLGQFLRQGDKVGAVVPAGKLRVVAEFLPPDALGRIRSGQSGRLRLEGFPWTQYGTLPTTVSNVAGEVRDGMVRVELAVDDGRGSRIPLQHGLPGSVEIAVDRVSPAALVLRTVGKTMVAPASSSPRRLPPAGN